MCGHAMKTVTGSPFSIQHVQIIDSAVGLLDLPGDAVEAVVELDKLVGSSFAVAVGELCPDTATHLAR